MRLSLQGAVESKQETHPNIKVECTRATWTFTYLNGYTINLRGTFTAHVRLIPGSHEPSRVWSSNAHPGYNMKIVQLFFDAETQEKYLSVDVIARGRIPEAPGLTQPEEGEDDTRMNGVAIVNAHVPVEPVNAFGIPQATMRCLEVRFSAS